MEHSFFFMKNKNEKTALAQSPSAFNNPPVLT